MEQMEIDFSGRKRTEAEQIYDAIMQEIGKTDYCELLNVAELKDGTISIKAKSAVVARVKLTNKESCIEIRAKNVGKIDPIILKKLEAEGEWIKIPAESIDDVLGKKKELGSAFMLAISEMGGERFGCCSRYMQCSDEKKCVNPNYMMSLGCAYKKNLEEGRIFYGKNKTV